MPSPPWTGGDAEQEILVFLAWLRERNSRLHEPRRNILHGSGVTNIEGHPDVPLTEKMLAYIPPATRHNVMNNGSQVLEYVWLVAPLQSAK